MSGVAITYDFALFTLATGNSDYDLKANISALFDNIGIARRVTIQADQTISFKFNNTLMPAIILLIGESPYQLPQNFLDVNNIYLTNASGSTVTMKVTLV